MKFAMILPPEGERPIQMELDPSIGKLTCQPHDLAFRCAGGHLQLRREALGAHDQRMIAADRQGILQPFEDPHPVMLHQRRLPMHGAPRPDDLAAIGVGKTLVAQADPEGRYVGRKFSKYIGAYPEVPWDRGMTGAGGDHDRVRVHLPDLVQIDGVVAEHPDVGAELADQLVKVVSERIVVVERRTFTPLPPLPFDLKEHRPARQERAELLLRLQESLADRSRPRARPGLHPDPASLTKAERMVMAESGSR
jgi:hypothetical protein